MPHILPALEAGFATQPTQPQEGIVMSEPTTEQPEPTQPDAPEATTEQPKQDVNDLPQWARDAITKANKEAANYRTQVADLRPKAEQFSALEEASKSELQRVTETAEKARRDAENAQAEAIRYKAAATHGISAEFFDLLGSGTEDEITARAQKIAALATAQAAATQAAAGPPVTRPVEQMRPGATPAEAASEDDLILAKLFGPPA